jgi:hypothetical protein
VFGYYDGQRLIYVARTRNGFTPLSREALFRKFKDLETTECPVVNLPEARSGRWSEGLTDRHAPPGGSRTGTADLERLEALRLLPRRWQRKFLKAWRITFEETYAWINFEVVEVLHTREEREWVHFGRIRQRSETSDPAADRLVNKSSVRKSQRRT